MERYGEYSDPRVGSRSPTDWYCLLRETQGDLSAYDEVDHMIDSSEFLLDSLFCEWAYIINVDVGVLEVYKGFNRRAGGSGRYAGTTKDNRYWGVALVASVPLTDLFNLSTDERYQLVGKWEETDC